MHIFKVFHKPPALKGFIPYFSSKCTQFFNSLVWKGRKNSPKRQFFPLEAPQSWVKGLDYPAFFGFNIVYIN